MILHLWEQPGFVIQLRDAAAGEHRVLSENKTPLWRDLAFIRRKSTCGTDAYVLCK